MWSISNLKNRGKIAFKRNYWKCVLVCLIVGIMMGGVANEASNSSDNKSSSKTTQFEYHPGQRYETNGFYFDDETGSFGYNEEFDTNDDWSDVVGDDAFIFNNPVSNALAGTAVAAFVVWVVVLCIFFIIVGILFDMFVINPFEVGSKRFFFVNQKENAKIKELAFAYDNGWKNAGVTLFFRDLYIFLWALLLIIPGIVKAYEYRMMPYILADHPDMDKDEVFALSKKLMHGEKWHAFVMDLSFIGWHILGVLTLGIVEVFYTLPYQASTNATLYEALKYLKIESVQNMYEEEFSQAERNPETGFSQADTKPESDDVTASKYTSSVDENRTEMNGEETTENQGLEDDRFDE